MIRAAPKQARGFTLLEVLLAVILLGLLIAGAYGGIRASANAMHAGERAIDRMDRVRTAQEFLRRQVSHILPLAFAHEQESGLLHVFDGGSSYMRFVAPMPGYLSRGGPYVQTLELARAADGLQLQFTSAMLNGYEDRQTAQAEAEPVVVLDRIRAGVFEYRTLDDQGQLTDWSSEWQDPAVTPLMIRIRLDMQPGVQIPWPELDVPVMLNAGAVRAQPQRTMVPANPANPPKARR